MVVSALLSQQPTKCDRDEKNGTKKSEREEEKEATVAICITQMKIAIMHVC